MLTRGVVIHVQGPDVFPIPGTKRLKYLEENAAAYFVELTAEDKRYLEETFHEDKVSIPLSRSGSGEEELFHGTQECTDIAIDRHSDCLKAQQLQRQVVASLLLAVPAVLCSSVQAKVRC